VKKKRCPRCGPQPLSNFSKNGSKKDGLASVCKTCQRAYGKAHYASNKSSYVARATRRKLSIHKEWREIVEATKAQPCADCKKSYPTYVMDFDHVRGVKRFNIGHGRKLGLNIERLRDEIAKCDVVCANCHRERTYGPHSSSGQSAPLRTGR
jgi:hypothetical protein